MGVRLVFNADDGTTGRELWVTDGSPAGTTLVKDINPGPDDSEPVFFAALGDGRLVFSADGTTGRELWVTDGSTAGTTLVKDIDPRVDLFDRVGSFPGGFAALGDGRLVFHAVGTTGVELWVTDGATAGTTLLKDINPGPGGGFPGEFTALGDGRLVFGADDGTGEELWVTDGSTAGTTLLKDINPGGFGFAALGDGRLVVDADDGTTGREPWVTDGSTAGTTLLKDINPGPGDSLPGGRPVGFAALGDGRLVFGADNGTTGVELWVTDGSTAGTTLVKDINPGPDDSSGKFAALGDGRLVFFADDRTTGRALWVTDGSAAGTTLLKDINPGPGFISLGVFPIGFAALGDGRLVFGADDGTIGPALWVTDGSTAGTTLVKDINPGPDDSFPGLGGFAALGDGRLVFGADDGTTGRELWVTDGSTAGTTLLKDINPGPGDSRPDEFTALGDGRVVFSADDGTGEELWVTDGTTAGTTLLKDINPGPGGSSPRQFAALVR